MYRHLSGVLTGTLSAAVIATGLLLLLHHSPGPERSVVGSAAVPAGSGASAAGTSYDLAGWCRDYMHGNQTLNASLESRLSGDGDGSGTDSPFIYVTVIQSKGIPVQGVYVNPAATAHSHSLKVPVINDAFAVC